MSTEVFCEVKFHWGLVEYLIDGNGIVSWLFWEFFHTRWNILFLHVGEHMWWDGTQVRWDWIKPSENWETWQNSNFLFAWRGQLVMIFDGIEGVGQESQMVVGVVGQEDQMVDLIGQEGNDREPDCGRGGGVRRVRLQLLGVVGQDEGGGSRNSSWGQPEVRGCYRSDEGSKHQMGWGSSQGMGLETSNAVPVMGWGSRQEWDIIQRWGLRHETVSYHTGMMGCHSLILADLFQQLCFLSGETIWGKISQNLTSLVCYLEISGNWGLWLAEMSCHMSLEWDLTEM